MDMVCAEEFVACRGDEITITARLLQNGSYGDPVPFQEVYFFDQTYNTFLGTSFTDINAMQIWIGKFLLIILSVQP